MLQHPVSVGNYYNASRRNDASGFRKARHQIKKNVRDLTRCHRFLVMLGRAMKILWIFCILNLSPLIVQSPKLINFQKLQSVKYSIFSSHFRVLSIESKVRKLCSVLCGLASYELGL